MSVCLHYALELSCSQEPPRVSQESPENLPRVYQEPQKPPKEPPKNPQKIIPFGAKALVVPLRKSCLVAQESLLELWEWSGYLDLLQVESLLYLLLLQIKLVYLILKYVRMKRREAEDASDDDAEEIQLNKPGQAKGHPRREVPRPQDHDFL